MADKYVIPFIVLQIRSMQMAKCEIIVGLFSGILFLAEIEYAIFIYFKLYVLNIYMF